jgi:hypothetical protein
MREGGSAKIAERLSKSGDKSDLKALRINFEFADKKFPLTRMSF